MTTIIGNKKGSTVTLHFTSNATLVIEGNNSVSNVALTDEEVASGYIRQVWFGTSNDSYWTVSRGADVVGVFDRTGQLDFAGSGNALTINPQANLSVTLNGTGDGFLMIELMKDSNLKGTVG